MVVNPLNSIIGQKIMDAKYEVDKKGRGHLHIVTTLQTKILSYSEDGKLLVEVCDKFGELLKIYGEDTEKD